MFHARRWKKALLSFANLLETLAKQEARQPPFVLFTPFEDKSV
jgi:hypothetical protein